MPGERIARELMRDPLPNRTAPNRRSRQAAPGVAGSPRRGSALRPCRSSVAGRYCLSPVDRQSTSTPTTCPASEQDRWSRDWRHRRCCSVGTKRQGRVACRAPDPRKTSKQAGAPALATEVPAPVGASLSRRASPRARRRLALWILVRMQSSLRARPGSSSGAYPGGLARRHLLQRQELGDVEARYGRGCCGPALRCPLSAPSGAGDQRSGRRVPTGQRAGSARSHAGQPLVSCRRAARSGHRRSGSARRDAGSTNGIVRPRVSRRCEPARSPAPN